MLIQDEWNCKCARNCRFKETKSAVRTVDRTEDCRIASARPGCNAVRFEGTRRVAAVVGLDVGTTALKGVLVGEDGRLLDEASAAYSARSPRPGWSEQDPDDWWGAAVQVLGRLRRTARPAAIGLSGQMHGSVFVDGTDRPVAPAILWNDQRTDAECAAIEALTDGHIAEWTLNPPRTAFTASKILWFRRHAPDAAARTTGVLLPKDSLRLRLTGARATDLTDASGTNLLDVRARVWSAAVLAALDIDPAWLPPAAESDAITGQVRSGLSELEGLGGVPVVAGAADQAAAAIGLGIVRPGLVSVTLGTSGVVYAQIPAVTVDPAGAFHTFCHSVPGTWMMMAGVLSAGGSVQWYRDVVDGRDFAAINTGALGVPPGAGGLLFLPYLTGERSPHNDPRARGAFVGLNRGHGPDHLARAVFEGVSFALCDLVDGLSALGVPIEAVRLAGGGARSPAWSRILASVLNRPLVTTTVADASAYGAAILAAAGTSGRSVAAVAADWVQPDGAVAPEPGAAARYRDLLPLFRDLYGATRGIVHRLGALMPTEVEEG